MGNPKFWYDLILPSHPAVTTTRPHMSVPFWQATFRNFNWDLDNERWLGVPGESFSSGHVAFPLVPCESSCMEMRSWRSVAWAPFQGTAREVWSDMKCSEDFMSFPRCKLLVTWDAEFNKWMELSLQEIIWFPSRVKDADTWFPWCFNPRNAHL